MTAIDSQVPIPIPPPTKTKKQRKKQARREARTMLRVTQAKKVVQKTEKRFTKIQNRLETRKARLSALEERLAGIQSQHTASDENQEPDSGSDPQQVQAETATEELWATDQGSQEETATGNGNAATAMPANLAAPEDQIDVSDSSNAVALAETPGSSEEEQSNES